MSKLNPWILIALFAFLTIAVYWPSLYGGFIFDDRYYVDSPDVHVTSLHIGDWIRAALSQAGSGQFRALSMLSFAANFYFTGLDPFWLKLTNVGIHLLNGMLLFLMLRELFALWLETSQQTAAESTCRLTAVVITAAWWLLPINLTAVAYVSQRLESLANLFVFLGLYWYLRSRRRHYKGDSGKWLPVSLIVCTLLGYSAKESAVLLPLYAICVEFALTRFRNNDGRISRPLVATNIVILLLPLIAGLAWISTWIFHSITDYREFSTAERLLTEPRVLFDYIHWTLLPNLNSLTFYHDDVAISHSLFDPPTTLLAILGLIALFGAAVWQRHARPLFCLGILWFFAGHALTATVIPLELVFEHRNYFPSVGLLLAVASLVALEPGLRLVSAKVLLAVGCIALFSFTTFLRAEEWSHPLRLAYSEALKRPQSPRAQYELARTLIQAAGDDTKSPLIAEATAVLERSAMSPGSGIAPLQALIFVNGRAGREIDPRWWQAILAYIRSHALSQTDIDSIVGLSTCQLNRLCAPQTEELLDVFTLALTRSRGNPYLLSAYADFALQRLGDADLAERMAREVVNKKPRVAVYRANLAKILLATGQPEAAEGVIADLAGMNHAGSLDVMILDLKARLSATKRGLPSSKSSPATVPESRSTR